MAIQTPVVEGLGCGMKPTVDQMNLLNVLVFGGHVVICRRIALSGDFSIAVA